MRIVTWNCAGALRRKTAAIDALGADILVVQECENPAASDSAYADWAGNYVWTGAIKHKGVGVFARNGIAIETLGWDGDGLAHFLPVRIGGRLDLLAVWTQPVVPSTYSYIGQFWQYLQRHRAALGSDSLICGDFNSNAIWDRKTRHWNHSDCVRELGQIGLVSLYHVASGEPQGAESQPTFFLHRNPAKPFHLDYLFAHASQVPPGWSGLEVGDPKDWLTLSDHMPVIVDL
jgi:endonuclease/exonuclease/phosphatase family metal-dependent hydrolase